METLKKNEVLLRNGNNWFHFKDPHKVIVAISLEAVPAALIEVEKQVEEHS